MYNRIDKTNGEKDIGVVIDDRLTFSEHLAEKINNANKLVGIIRRTFVHLDEAMFKALYTAIVRPHLEYANQVWSPHLIKDIESIENVQRRATKLIPQIKDLPYEERLRKLDLPTLAYKRSRGDMIETFKIVSAKYDQDCIEGIFKMREENVTRGNTRKIFKTRARLNLRKYSFSIRVVNNWNELPEWVVNADNIEKFEVYLDKFWKDQEQKFNHRAQISSVRDHHQGSGETMELESQA